MEPLDLLEYAAASRIAEAELVRKLEMVACGWCGMFSPAGAACECCGSPLLLHRTCPHCGRVSTSAFCWSCQASIEQRNRLRTSLS